MNKFIEENVLDEYDDDQEVVENRDVRSNSDSDDARS